MKIKELDSMFKMIEKYRKKWDITPDFTPEQTIYALENRLTEMKVELEYSNVLLETNWISTDDNVPTVTATEQESIDLWIVCDESLVQGKFCRWKDHDPLKCFYEYGTHSWVTNPTHYAYVTWPKPP